MSATVIDFSEHARRRGRAVCPDPEPIPIPDAMDQGLMLLLRVLPDLQDKPADFESLLERLSEAARGELLAGRLEGSTAIMAVRLLLMAGTGRG